MPPKPQKPPEKPRFDWPMKRCKYCKVRFKPRSDHHGRTQECCTPDHRKLYHKHGGLQFDKLIARILKDKAIKALVQRIEDLEAAAKRREERENEWPDPEAHEPACIDWESIDRARAAH